MRRWRRGRIAFVALALVAAAGVALVLVPYRRDLDAARARVARDGQIARTACGPIEFATASRGMPVLVVHGAGGGYDQGLMFGRLVLGDRFRTIAPSRFGHLGSPIPEDASVEAQADAFACLLDALGIDRLPVLGVSAGGPSAAMFAARHRERTSALILLAAISDPSAPRSRLADVVTGAFLRSDLLYWLLLEFARPFLVRVLGVPLEVQTRLPPQEREQVREVLELMHPLSARSPGTLMDQRQFQTLLLPLEEVRAPTLVIHARDDVLVDFSNGIHSAERVEGAKLVALEDGGHLLVGHHSGIRRRIGAFLDGVAASR